MRIEWKQITFTAVGAVVLAGTGYLVWRTVQPSEPGEGFVRSNGRIEATEIDVSCRVAGRLVEVLVEEGDFVEAGQIVARIQVDTLVAQLDEARAQLAQSQAAVAAQQAQVTARESDRRVALFVVAQRGIELDTARSRLARSEELGAQSILPPQDLDDQRAIVRGAEAGLEAARSQVSAAEAAIEAARAQRIGAEAAVTASRASAARIEAEINDCTLRAPRAGRVQYRVANVGEVVGAGGRVLSMVDLSDVFMTFFVPSKVAGRITIGSESRLVLDAAPEYVIPATVSFVSAQAQFTPKSVETASEREKLMFRIRARVDRELLLRHLTQVKTGLPGVAWLRADPARDWPESLSVRLPE